MLTLRLVSETASTITLGWDPVAGAVGYRFTAEKQARPSHTWDPARSAVRFAKGSAWYRVEPLLAPERGEWPPSSSQPLFDGLASRMVSVTGSTLYLGGPGWAGGSNASQDPHIWGYKETEIASGIYVIGDDVTLVPDARYGKVFRFTVGVGSSNPYLDLNADGRAAAEMTIQRPITMGQWDWYATAFRIVSPVNLKNWHVVSQFGYPSITSPPLSICYDPNGLGIDRHAGVYNGADFTGMTIDKPRFYKLADVTGKWVEYLIGVRWAMDATGEIHVWACCRDLGETTLGLKVSRPSTVTFQQRQGQSVKSAVNDKVGNYFGQYSSRAGILTNIVDHRGFQRYADEASARASLS